MKQSKIFNFITSFLFLFLSLNINLFSQKFLDPDYLKSIDKRVDSVLALMTLDEKIGQLNQLSYGSGWGPTVKVNIKDEYINLIREGKVGSFFNASGAELTKELQKIAIEESRLKIPLIFGLDVIHGFRTTFPVPIAEASTWNPELVELSAHYQALEASAAGIHWTFSPMVDIARDPRWGRIMEGSGEDPYLGSIMAEARVKGYQGDLSTQNIIACPKHFAAYGGAEGGRDYNTVDISEVTFRDVYLRPFKAAFDAGALTTMASFNEIAGVPSSANKHLLTDILRNEWNFKGFVVSDWNSVGELVPHGVAENLKDAGNLAINAGLDMDMESRSYITHLFELVKENKLSEETINKSVRRILRVKFLLGLFDNPYAYCDIQREKNTIMSKEIQDAALKVAQESIVLLKNEKNILPLKKDIKTIAVIGPLADDKENPLGGWAAFGNPDDVLSVIDGLKNKVSNTKILYSKGCEIESDSKDGFSDAISKAKNSDVVILVLGEGRDMSGEARNRASLNLPGVQEDLVKEIYKTGKPIVVILMNGRPLSIEWIDKNISGIIEAWFPGIKAGQAIADVLFGDINPSGKLPVTFPRTVGQVPIYYNHKNTGRPPSILNPFSSKYIDVPYTPLYPFGFGLSYTNFNYNNLQLNKDKISFNDTLSITIQVKNIGNYDGKEVVQLYIQDLVGSITRPVKELKRFKKIFLKKGETQTVEFKITKDDLAFWTWESNSSLIGKDVKYIIEPGKFKVFVGTNSDKVLEKEFELTNN